MALILRDRVKETTTTAGTGTITLAGAVAGYQSFSAVGNGNETYYCIAGQGTSEWEVGIGVYTSSGTTLSRATVLASSNSGSLVTFSAGTKDVFCTFPASRALPALQYALYTSNTNWVCPTGVTKIRVTCIAGGGGGAAYDSSTPQNGGSGGRGGIAIGIYTVNPGTSYAVTVGGGGAGNNSGNGSSGSSSSLGSLCSATGGAGGIDGASGGGDGADGAGTSGITTNSSVVFGTGGDFAGLTQRENATSATAATTWSVSLTRIPGSSGAGGRAPGSNATGGTSGAILIQYVG
jgi:hypothetical protein